MRSRIRQAKCSNHDMKHSLFIGDQPMKSSGLKSRIADGYEGKLCSRWGSSEIPRKSWGAGAQVTTFPSYPDSWAPLSQKWFAAQNFCSKHPCPHHLGLHTLFLKALARARRRFCEKPIAAKLGQWREKNMLASTNCYATYETTLNSASLPNTGISHYIRLSEV